MTRPTVISQPRNTTIIQGHVIMAIGVINSVSHWGGLAPQWGELLQSYVAA
jgi:hypothetical protein